MECLRYAHVTTAETDNGDGGEEGEAASEPAHALALTTVDLVGTCREVVRRTCGGRGGQERGSGEAAGPRVGGGAGGSGGGVAAGAHGASAAARGGGDRGGEGAGAGAVPARSTALMRDVC